MSNKKLKNKKAFSLVEMSIVILIVGIVIAAITHGSRMLEASRLASARLLTGSSPVINIPDLTLWLDATSERSFDVADQFDELAIDNWYDTNPQLTSRINFTQSNGSLQPTYEVNGINNMPCVQFDGVDDYYSLAASKILNDITAPDQITIFTVQKLFTLSQANSFFIYKSSNDAIRVSSHFPQSGSGYMFDFGTCCNAGQGRITASYPSSYTNKSMIVMWKIKAGNATIKVNGSSILSSGMSSTFVGSDLMSPLSFLIGTISSGGYNFNGYIGEMIIFKRGLNLEEIGLVEKYLAKKWAIPI